MAIQINKEVTTKNTVETMKEINTQPNMELGEEQIEFADGTKIKFQYNGEADKQAAIKFAEICINNTSNPTEAKHRMFICQNLLKKKINPEREIKIKDITLYLDAKKKALYTCFGDVYVELTDDEKKVKMSTDALAMLLKEKAERKYESNCYDECEDDHDDDKDDCDGDCECCCFNNCIYDC